MFIASRDPMKPIDMKDWKFAFEVDFSTLDVPPSSEEHKQAKERLNQPGDYSISRLFLDFKSELPCNRYILVVAKHP
jgi:hypothetical protein